MCARPVGSSLSEDVPVARRPRAWLVALVLLVDAGLAAVGGMWILEWVRAAPPVKTVAAPVVAPQPAPPRAAEPAPAPAPAPAKRPTAATTSPPPPPTVPARGSALPSKPPPLPTPPAPVVPPSRPDAAPPPPPDAPPPPPPPPEPDAPPPDEPDAPAVDRAWVDQMTAGIRQVVNDHREPVRDCYRRAAKQSSPLNPLHGRVEVHLRIRVEGDADDVRVVENQTGSEELGACLVALMQTWRYPAPGPEAMEFVWPFTFKGQR